MARDSKYSPLKSKIQDYNELIMINLAEELTIMRNEVIHPCINQLIDYYIPKCQIYAGGSSMSSPTLKDQN